MAETNKTTTTESTVKDPTKATATKTVPEATKVEKATKKEKSSRRKKRGCW